MSSQYPQQPAEYQGRRLPRPEEELVDQGLAFDVGTLIGRRRALQLLGLGAAAVGLAACSSPAADSSTTLPASSQGSPAAAGSDGASAAGSAGSAATGSTATGSTTTGSTAAGSTAAGDLTEIPDETAGPYPGDGSNGPDVLETSGVVRTDLRSSFGTGSATAEGIPMTLTLTILDIANGGAPFAGVAVYVWHCNRDGAYSLYGTGLEDENYLRGVQIADDAGQVTFSSIVPACYSGRWPHIHFEVYPDRASIIDSTKAIATSQVALPQNICDQVYATSGYEQSVTNLKQVTLSSDNVFGDDSGVHQIATVTGDVASGFAVALTAPVDTTTEPTGGSAPAGGGGGPAGGGGGPGGDGGAAGTSSATSS
ncbi:intradiol ring-cleavage dioxygenase [Nakamurella lactea]|uniref:intradiol ring-cleavage dioxygenase n=1 Tax=Nakamurella lactea TaxID=459515 RepID=UPI00056BD944|nr:intradiol ring-cleavage dioxygenase [Nakamurella lactea]